MKVRGLCKKIKKNRFSLDKTSPRENTNSNYSTDVLKIQKLSIKIATETASQICSIKKLF